MKTIITIFYLILLHVGFLTPVCWGFAPGLFRGRERIEPRFFSSTSFAKSLTRKFDGPHPIFFHTHHTRLPIRHQCQSTSLLAARRTVTKTATGIVPDLWDHPWTQALRTTVAPLLTRIWDELCAFSAVQRSLFVAVFLLGIQLGKSNRFSMRRYKEAVDIPSVYFGPKARYLKGRVVSVSDGDTLRFYHIPTPFHSSTLKPKQKKSDHTLPIRICTIDTPETPKFGKPGQPFGIEAKERLQGLVDQKRVYVRLLSKDQYGRAVGQVFAPSFFPPGKCVDEIMLQDGLAEVYQGMGAVYGPKGKDAYLAMEEKAQKAKLGIWSQGKRESAAEYKKRTK